MNACILFFYSNLFFNVFYICYSFSKTFNAWYNVLELATIYVHFCNSQEQVKYWGNIIYVFQGWFQYYWSLYLFIYVSGELHGLVHRLINLKPPNVLYRPTSTPLLVPHYDVLAMAYIIITLKLLFGLDDFTER